MRQVLDELLENLLKHDPPPPPGGGALRKQIFESNDRPAVLDAIESFFASSSLARQML